MAASATATRWPGFGYQQVPGLANRIISRYLRAQRRNMLRFFLERGFLDLAERMRQIKLSRQGMMAKNRMFQKVLDDYTKRTTPQPISEAAPPAQVVPTDLGMLDSQPPNGEDLRDRQDAESSVRRVGAPDDSKSGEGIVIEE